MTKTYSPSIQKLVERAERAAKAKRTKKAPKRRKAAPKRKRAKKAKKRSKKRSKKAKARRGGKSKSKSKRKHAKHTPGYTARRGLASRLVGRLRAAVGEAALGEREARADLLEAEELGGPAFEAAEARYAEALARQDAALGSGFMAARRFAKPSSGMLRRMGKA